MDVAFTAEQHALRDAARALFERDSPPSRLRKLWTDGGARDEGVWRAMGEMGLLGLGVPEALGGAGGDETDLVLVLEAAGRAALPEPLLEAAAVAAPVLAAHGSDAQRDRWLPRIARGEAIATIGLAGAPFVVDADVADLLIVERAGALHAVPRDRFRARPVPTEDRARRLFAVDADLADDTRLPGGGAVEAFERAAAAAAAVLNGIAMRLLEMTIAHVEARHQFGRPVGSFQAVKHAIASAYVLSESSRPAAWYAAYARARRLTDAGDAAAVAKAYASDAAASANAVALQCHGGIGFTWEHDLHFWLKREKALEHAYGSAREHRARVAARALDGAARVPRLGEAGDDA